MNDTAHLEDFTNAVIAIVTTLMILDIKAPTNATLNSLMYSSNHILTYIYSFILISMYWINHSRIFRHSPNVKINLKILWANNLFLLLITFIPFATSWLARHIMNRVPELFYASLMLCIDLSFYLLLHEVLLQNPQIQKLPKAKVFLLKLHINLFINILAIIVGYSYPLSTIFISLCAVIIWIVPDKSIYDTMINK